MKSRSVKLLLLYYTCLVAGMLGEVSSSEPRHGLGRVVPGHKTPLAAGGAEFTLSPQRKLCAIWLRTAQNSSARHRCVATAPGLPRAYLPARQRAIMQNGLHWKEKKKGGGGIISAGVFMWFFFFFLIFLNPTGSLIII